MIPPVVGIQALMGKSQKQVLMRRAVQKTATGVITIRKGDMKKWTMRCASAIVLVSDASEIVLLDEAERATISTTASTTFIMNVVGNGNVHSVTRSLLGEITNVLGKENGIGMSVMLKVLTMMSDRAGESLQDVKENDIRSVGAIIALSVPVKEVAAEIEIGAGIEPVAGNEDENPPSGTNATPAETVTTKTCYQGCKV